MGDVADGYNKYYAITRDELTQALSYTELDVNFVNQVLNAVAESAQTTYFEFQNTS